jgi:hypothetical protein
MAEEKTKKIPDNNKKIVADVLAFLCAWLPKFKVDWDNADKSLEMIFGEHWDDKEKLAHEEQGRQAFNIPLQFGKIMGVLGFERQNRKEAFAEPDGMEDELLAQLYNVLFSRIRKKSYQDFLDSWVFFYAICAYVGIVKVEEYTNDDGMKELRNVLIPYRKIIWDRSAMDYALRDCKRFQEIDYKFVDDLKKEYGEDFAEWDDIETSLMNEDYPFINMHNIQDIYQYETVNLKSGERKVNKRVRVIYDYYLRPMEIYELIDLKSLKKEAFEDKDDAEEEMKTKYEEIKANASQAMALSPMNEFGVMNEVKVPPIEELFAIKPRMIERVQETVVAGSVLLEEPHMTDYDDFDYTVFRSIFYNGKSRTPADVTRDLQTVYDRYFSQSDFAIGVQNRTSNEINTKVLDTSVNDAEQASEKLKEGKDIYTIGGQAVRPVAQKGAPNELFAPMEMMRAIGEESFGSKYFQGGANADDSGRKVALLQMAGANINNVYIDNFNFTKIVHWEKVVKRIKNVYRREMTLKVLGKDMSEKVMQALQENKMYKESLTEENAGWVIIQPENEKLRKKFWEASLAINISTVNSTFDEAANKLNMLLKFREITGVNIPAELFAKYMNFSATETAMLKKAEEEDAKMKQMQMNMQIEAMKNKGATDTLRAVTPMIQNQNNGMPHGG